MVSLARGTVARTRSVHGTEVAQLAAEEGLALLLASCNRTIPLRFGCDTLRRSDVPDSFPGNKAKGNEQKRIGKLG